jgi:hypothetical protein
MIAEHEDYWARRQLILARLRKNADSLQQSHRRLYIQYSMFRRDSRDCLPQFL